LWTQRRSQTDKIIITAAATIIIIRVGEPDASGTGGRSRRASEGGLARRYIDIRALSTTVDMCILTNVGT